MKSPIILSLALLLGATVNAQNEEDALRYSMTYFGGTARNIATAGALTALGGDFSNASQNPAGLGRLTKSNFSFTQNVEIANSKTDFYGTQTKDNRLRYNFSNLSYVKAYKLNPNKFRNWYGVQIGIGMSRIKSFNQDFTVAGEVDSSILHSFINEANGTATQDIYDFHPFGAGLAYDTYAIDPAPGNTYVTDFTLGKSVHNRSVRREGGITEFNLLTISGNYSNKLLIGASFNYLNVNYGETFTHDETFTDTSLWIQSIKYTGQLDITGRGLNARIGAIYMPIPQLRIAAAIETPSIYYMNDYWTNNMETNTDEGLKFIDNVNVPSGSYKYNVRTPFKANGSVAFVLRKFGSIGAEIEYVDYGNAKLKSKKFSTAPYSFAAENTQIDNLYRSVVNIKVGIEARITKQFYARGGFASYQTPYKSESGNNLSPTTFITGGLGYNFGIWYIDMAYMLQNKKEDYYSYDPTLNGSMSLVNASNSRILLSVGARF